MRVFVAALLLSACVDTSTRLQRLLPPDAIDICETCVGEINGYRIGVSNIWPRELAGSDGVVRTRDSGMLSIWPANGQPEEPARPAQVVAVGSEVTLGGATYRVLAIDSPAHAKGSIALGKK